MHEKRPGIRHQTSQPPPLLPCFSLRIHTATVKRSWSVAKAYGCYDSWAVVENKNSCYKQKLIQHYYHLLNSKKEYRTKPRTEIRALVWRNCITRKKHQRIGLTGLLRFPIFLQQGCTVTAAVLTYNFAWTFTMITTGRIITSNYCTIQIQLGRRTEIQQHLGLAVSLHRTNRTTKFNRSSLHIKANQTTDQVRQIKNASLQHWCLSLPVFRPAVWTSALRVHTKKSVIGSFCLHIPDIFPPASCWGYGSCDSVLLSSLRNVGKNNWIETDWQDL